MLAPFGAALGRPASAAAALVAANIFNIQFATTDIAYSESNALATWSAATHPAAILIVPTGGAGSGKRVLEFEIVDATGTIIVGVTDMASLSGPTTRPDTTATGWGYVKSGNKITNSSQAAYGASYTTNDKISLLINESGGLVDLSFAKGGVDQGVAYSGISGTLMPYVAIAGGSVIAVRVSAALSYTFAGYTQLR